MFVCLNCIYILIVSCLFACLLNLKFLCLLDFSEVLALEHCSNNAVTIPLAGKCNGTQT